MSSPPDTVTARQGALIAAELGVLALALGVVTSLNRLFVGWGWWWTLAVPVLVAWATSVGTRRIGMRPLPATAVQAIVGVLVLSWMFAPGSLATVLPTPATALALSDEVRESFGAFSDLVAPVPATDGFLVVIAAALWVISAFADAAAIRYRAPVQAAVPHLATFAAIGILARDAGRVGAAVAMVTALAVFTATQLALAASEQRWVGARVGQGARAVAAGTIALAVVAALGGLLIGPRLPGSDEAVVDLRELGRGAGPRTVVSPFVGIRSLLGDQSDRVMFEVDADAAAYWRLTALEEFDPEREIWVSRGSYQRTDGSLPRSPVGPRNGDQLRQEFRLEGLATTWLPAAYTPTRVDSSVELGFDSLSSSLIVRDDVPADPLTYELDSLVPDVAPLLAQGPPALSTELDREYLRDPGLTPEQLGRLPQTVLDAPDPYRRMLELQRWFRDEFAYDDTVDYSDRPDALVAFLENRRGFCQQFSSAFALFARELGVPSRVAVGFTPGDPVAADNGSTTFVVRGRHAHAWPEVYFEGVGWVPFEPTPQRGNPQATEFTGVAPQQADPPPEQAATTTSTTTTIAATSTVPPTTSAGLDAVAAAPEDPARGDRSGPPGWLVAVLLLTGTAAAILTAVVLRRRDRWRRAVGDQAVATAWHVAVQAVAPLDLRRSPDETPIEFARRADQRLGEDLLAPLAELETLRRFAAAPRSPDEVRLARELATAVEQHVASVTTRRRRLVTSLGR